MPAENSFETKISLFANGCNVVRKFMDLHLCNNKLYLKAIPYTMRQKFMLSEMIEIK
jgi:hypothetical protein